MIDDDDFKPALDSSEVVEALEFWTRLCRLGLARPDEPWFQAPQEFVRGHCAVLYHTFGSLEFLAANAEFEVGVWPLPYRTTPAVEIGGANFVILANRPQEQQKAAWQFIDWFTRPEQSAEWAIGTGYLPVRSSSFELPTYMSHLKSLPDAETAAAQRDRACPRTSAPYFAKLDPLILDAIAETLRGDRTPRESLASIQNAAIKMVSL